MKGLMIKDFLLFWKNAKIILAVYVIGIVVSFFKASSNFLTVFITLFSIMWIVNLFALDLQAKWDPYCVGLPVPRRKIVLARYLFFLLIVLAGTILIMADGIAVAFRYGGGWAEASRAMNEAWIMMGGCLIFVSILLPFVYQFGINKARFIVIVVAILSAILVSIIGNGNSDEMTAPYLDKILSSLNWILPLGGAALFLISYAISGAIFLNKEL